MRAIIVGGGIGGLAAAIALSKAGYQVSVLEQAGRYDEVGSGLSVWPNAVRALDALGLGRQLRERSRPVHGSVIRDRRGRELSRTDVAQIERRFGPLLIVHRADLLELLRTSIPSGAIRSGVRVTSVTADGAVTHDHGGEHADLVVGADGINSVVRRSLLPQAPPRYAGCSAYRMITEPVDVPGGGESWGRGEIFGYAPLPGGRVYCFASLSGPPGTPGDSIEQLRDRFADWHAPIPQLLAAVQPEAVLHHDLFDLPPLPSYVRGRVALLGDAAHAMTPNLGQGAGQAIEDAVTLAASLTRHRSLPDALRSYDEERRPRTQAIAARSRRIGTVAGWRAAPAVAARDLLLRLSPDASLLRSLEPVLTWQAPDLQEAVHLLR